MNSNKFPNINSEQADNLVELVKEMFGTELSNMMGSSGININHLIRFLYISTLCREKRQEKGLSFKDVSAQLKVPQYRLKEIEENSIRNILPDVFDKYIDYLGLQNEFYEWLKENKDAYEELGEGKPV